LVPVNGALPVVLPTVEPGLLASFEAPPDRRAWWEARLAAVLAVRKAPRP
jgi:o-succinylbenzoate synthase